MPFFRNSTASSLFKPYRMGSLTLPNRIVMAPMTRARASRETDAPNDLIAEYYAQRATAGLIISEATYISPRGKGYAFTPGCFSPAHEMGWSDVTRAVHNKGGRIFAQLWHVGRISHPSLQPGGAAPIAPSALRPAGKAFTESGFLDHDMPRALDTEEVPVIVDEFRHAAAVAKRAGFDGVELHAANGYLIDQFLRDGTNKRTDRYGGPIKNRIRFALEVVDAVVSVWPSDRVGIRLSPGSTYNDITDSTPQKTFGTLVAALNGFKLAYLHLVEGLTGGAREGTGVDYRKLRKRFKGTYIANNGYTRDMAADAVRKRQAELVAFGTPYLANPDLVARFRRNAPLNAVRREFIYGDIEPEGYTDYPALD